MPNSLPQSLDRVFHALGDPTRLAMVQRLAEQPLSVSEIAGPLTMAMPTVMQHLRVLEDAALVRSRKTGRVRICEIRRETLEGVQDWLSVQRQVWEARTDRLEAFVATLKEREKTND